jgi:hypothetical protein
LNGELVTDLVIPNGVKEIKRGAFLCCSSLTSVSIPDSVTSIGVLAFCQCTNLTKIIFNGTIRQWEQLEKGENWDEDVKKYVVICTDGKVNK